MIWLIVATPSGSGVSMFQSKKMDTAGAVQSSAGGAEAAVGTGGGGGADRRATKSSHLLMLSASFVPDFMKPRAMPHWFLASTAQVQRLSCATRKPASPTAATAVS